MGKCEFVWSSAYWGYHFSSAGSRLMKGALVDCCIHYLPFISLIFSFDMLRPHPSEGGAGRPPALSLDGLTLTYGLLFCVFILGWILMAGVMVRCLISLYCFFQFHSSHNHEIIFMFRYLCVSSCSGLHIHTTQLNFTYRHASSYATTFIPPFSFIPSYLTSMIYISYHHIPP